MVALLRAKDQTLLNAFPAGNRAVWEKEVALDFVYVAEDGTVVERADFLKALVPSPPYDIQPLKIHDYKVAVLGEVAVVVHLDNEVGQYRGSKLTGQYLATETWQRIAGEWKLRSVHVSAVPTNPPAVELPAIQLDELAGTYRAGPDTYTLRREGGRLLARSSDGSESEWKAETRDTFFVPGRTRLRALVRAMSNRSGSGKRAGSRFAAA